MLHAAAVWFAEAFFWVPGFLYHTFVVRCERLCGACVPPDASWFGTQRYELAKILVPWAAALLVLPLCIVNSRLLWANRAEVRRLSRLGVIALRKRGSRLVRRVVGTVWEESFTLPSLVLYATGASLQDASLRGPGLARTLHSIVMDLAALPEALALACLDAVAALRNTGLSGTALRSVFRDAATLPAKLAQALGLSDLAALLADVVRGGGGPLPVVKRVADASS
jgi:hypothetical protein